MAIWIWKVEKTKLKPYNYIWMAEIETYLIICTLSLKKFTCHPIRIYCLHNFWGPYLKVKKYIIDSILW